MKYFTERSMKTKLTFSYYNNEYTIDISNNQEILQLIENKIITCKHPYVTFPNDDVDDKIREFVDEELKRSEFYRGTGHADKILIYRESNDPKIEKLHLINGAFSDKSMQEIIEGIRKRYDSQF